YLTEATGDLFAGEFGEWGSDEWFDSLTGLAADANDLIGDYDASATRPDAYYVVAKVVTTMAAQHRYHRSAHHDWRVCRVCSPPVLDSDPYVDFGSSSDPT